MTVLAVIAATTLGSVAAAEAPDADVDRLYDAAQHHLRSANEKVEAPDWRVRLDAAVHAGAAVELMAKAVLAGLDVRLVRREHHSVRGIVNLLIENGNLDATPYDLSPNRTIGAEEALDLLSRLEEGLRPFCASAKKALAARNAAVHLAEAQDGLADAVTAGSDFVLAGVDRLGRDRTAFLGDALAERVQREVAERRTVIERQAQQKVDRARATFDAYLGLDEWIRELFLAQVRDRRPRRPDVTDPHDCPACHNRGWMFSNVDVDEAADPDEVVAYLDFLGFRCYFCGLELDSEECDAIGLDPHGDPADHFTVLPDDAPG